MNKINKVLIVLAEEASTAAGTGTLFRLQKAVCWLEQNQVDLVILSGGKYTSGQKKSTARLMHDWLYNQFYKNREVPPFQIIEEDNSRDTNENIVFSLVYVNTEIDKIFIISERHHLRRIEHILKRYDIKPELIPVDYKNLIGRFWEHLLYFYTLLDPKYVGLLALYHNYVFRKN